MPGMNPESICKRDTVALFLVQLDVLVAPEPDKISREKCTPTVALLFCDTKASLYTLG